MFEIEDGYLDIDKTNLVDPDEWVEKPYPSVVRWREEHGTDGRVTFGRDGVPNPEPWGSSSLGGDTACGEQSDEIMIAFSALTDLAAVMEALIKEPATAVRNIQGLSCFLFDCLKKWSEDATTARLRGDYLEIDGVRYHMEKWIAHTLLEWVIVREGLAADYEIGGGSSLSLKELISRLDALTNATEVNIEQFEKLLDEIRYTHTQKTIRRTRFFYVELECEHVDSIPLPLDITCCEYVDPILPPMDDDAQSALLVLEEEKSPYPYLTETVVFGMHRYRRADEDSSVFFVDETRGIRKMLVDSKGRIHYFPGIKDKAAVEKIVGSRALEPQIRFRTSFEKQEDRWKVCWQVQPDGRYWEDEDGFGGTDDEEVTLYTYVDANGDFTGPFRLCLD